MNTKPCTYNNGFYDKELQEINKRFKEHPEECWSCGSKSDYRMLSFPFSGEVFGRGCEENKHWKADFLYDK